MSNSKKDLSSDDIYSGAASLGRITAIIGAVVMTIVGIVLIIVGIVILNTKNTTVKTKAEVLSATCSPWANQGAINYRCNVHFTYLVGKEQMIGDLVINSVTQYQKNQKFDVYYEKDNPSDVKDSGPTPHSLGWILLATGILLPLLAWGWVWVTRKYKMAAAAQGAESVLDMLRR